MGNNYNVSVVANISGDKVKPIQHEEVVEVTGKMLAAELALSKNKFGNNRAGCGFSINVR